MLYSLHFFHFCLECITSKNEVKTVGLDQISYRYERMSFDKVGLFQDGDRIFNIASTSTTQNMI